MKFDGRLLLTNEFVAGAWTIPEMTLSPGEAALLRSPVKWDHTWVGLVEQGELKVMIPAGCSFKSSLVPQRGKLSEALGFPKIVGTSIFKIDPISGQFVKRATCAETGWEPEEPAMGDAEGFYVESPREFIWSRPFFVSDDPRTPPESIIISQPENQEVKNGETITLSVELANPNDWFYQWQLNGNDIASANGPTLTIPNAGPQHSGSYWVKLWGNFLWIWSDVARVWAPGSEIPRLTIRKKFDGLGAFLAPQGITWENSTMEVSEDLIHWGDIGAAEPAGANFLFDPFSEMVTKRFYRLKKQ